MKKIILTGGGSAGHVNPNIALLPTLLNNDYKVYYIGSKNGIEKTLISPLNINYFEISTGKLRRYLDIKNLTDSFKVLKGVMDSYKILKTIKPTVVFSKGGFVSVPVVIAAKILNIPTIIHESDITPGLANKIAFSFADKICVTFPETKLKINKKNVILTGSPIREEIFKGKKEEAYKICNFEKTKKILLFMGGSLGSNKINSTLRSCLDELLKNYQIIHLCGNGNVDKSINKNGYFQMEYAHKELPHFLKCCSLVISRAGSNSICEIAALQKPSLLIPLSKKASRGDQILNAQSFEKQGFNSKNFN